MAFKTKSDYIVWSHEYTIPDFLAAYGKKLPQVVKVAQGFHGDYLVDSISTEDILRVEKSSKQKRVLGQDAVDRPLSIIINFCPDLELVLPDETFSEPTPLKQLLDSNQLPIKVHLPGLPAVTSSKEDMDVIRLNSVIEDRYLLVNCILTDELESIVRMIPGDLDDVRLIVATGFDRARFDWKDFIAELNQAASLLDYNGITGSSNVALRSRSLTSGHAENQLKWENKKTERKLSSDLEGLKDKGVAKFRKVVNDLKKHVHNVNVKNDKATPYEDLDLSKSANDTIDSYEFIDIRPKVRTGKSVSMDSASEPPGHYGRATGPSIPARTDLVSQRHEGTVQLESSWGEDNKPTKSAPPIAPKPKVKSNLTKVSDKPSSGNTESEVDSKDYLQLFYSRNLNQNEQASKESTSTPANKPKMSVKPLTSVQGSPSTNQIATFRDIPKDLSPMNTGDIVDCLKLLQLDESTIQMFHDKHLDGCFLNLISEEDFREFLQNETGLSLIDRERTVNLLKKGWRPS